MSYRPGVGRLKVDMDDAVLLAHHIAIGVDIIVVGVSTFAVETRSALVLVGGFVQLDL